MSAVRTRHHLAVVAGPDVGWVVPLPSDRRIVVGRGADADLCLDDPGLSRRQLEVRARGERVRVRAVRRRGAATRSVRRRRSGRIRVGRSRRLGARWRTVRADTYLSAGGSTLQLRDHPALAPPAPREPDRAELSDGLGMRLLVPLAMAASMVPLALTSSGTSPWRTITWLVLPLVLVAAVLWPWLKQRAAHRRQHADDRSQRPPQPPDPAGLLARAEAPWTEPQALAGRAEAHEPHPWDAGTTGKGRRRHVRLVPPPTLGTGVAVVGPPPAAAALARWLVCQVAHRHPPDRLRLVLPPGWDWAAPLPHLGAGGEGRAVVEVHDVSQAPGAVPRLAPDAVGVVVASSLTLVPPWCTTVIEVSTEHDRQVSPAWAAEVADALARAGAAGRTLPAVLPLRDLVGDPTPEALLTAWRARTPGLTAPLGADAEAPLQLDLAADGPHALVAGTTGSGKSELLTTWVLGLALAHPPADLHALLVDYKGGATFGVLADLPHVLGVLTDLDTEGTARALASLRAELARRERVLAQAGARSLAELAARGQRLPRLLVMVDEFRAMADSHPDLLDGLVRLAAQGRSLGVHLVLATQRPGGAVTADMRANISVRLCLRVLEPSDSIDVLGEGSAAQLPAVPGRAVLRTDSARTVQVAWPGGADDGVAHLVALVRGAAALAESGDPELVGVTAPWAPPLPAELSTGELSMPDLPSGPAGLPLLLLDRPEQQRVEAWGLPVGENLLISGPPGSGRTAAARTLATEAARRGVVTHVIGHAPLLPPQALATGTVCAPEDLRRVHRLLTADGGRGELLVLDDVDALVQAIDATLPFGTGAELVLALLRTAGRRGLGVVLTAAPPANRWAAATRRHLVLAPRDVNDALVAGIPREMVPHAAPPGRGVLLEGGAAVAAQVALAQESGPWPRPDRPVRRVLPLPDLVDLPLGAGGPDVLVGLGGDDCAPVRAALRPGGRWLVLGQAGSGRSTALGTIAARLAAAGRPVWTAPGAVTDEPGGVLVVDDVDRLSPAAAAAAADAAQRAGAVVAAARPDPLSSAFHELARMLRDPDLTLVLGSPAGTGPWTGADLRSLADTRARPGRGVLVDGGRAVALQVDRCGQTMVPVPLEGRLVAATEAGSSRPTPMSSDATIVG